MPEGAVYVAPFVCGVFAVALVSIAGAIFPNRAGYLSSAMAVVTFAVLAWLWQDGGGTFNVAWAATLDLRLHFRLDGLAALYGLLASGIGIAVLIYSTRYLPLHLKHESRPIQDATRFFAFIVLFMTSMIGLVMAQDIILLFLFWDLTAIASYFLIGYDQHKREARSSALMALLVTGISSVLYIIAAAILYADYGTFSLPALFENAQPGSRLTLAAALIAVAGLAKCAQIPLHFWLPRAMVAPTPVSAYLHSAAMVAAGVFLLERFYPLIATSTILLNALLVIGMVSMTIGGILALTAPALKRILAYSTIAQYGYVVFMLGLGGEYGVSAASFYVIAHGLSKSALFLTAGTATEATGQDQLARLGGLLRSMPLLAVGSGLAAAGLSAFPLTIGFFKDELLFKASLERGTFFATFAVFGAALTLAYMWRFWRGLFLGPVRTEAKPVSPVLVWPVVILGILVFAGGLFSGGVAALAAAAGEAALLRPTPVEVAYHLDFRDVNLMALATYSLGVLIIVTRRWWESAARAMADAGRRFGPEYLYETSLAQLNRFSERMLEFEVRDLRRRVSTIFVPAALLMVVGLIVSPFPGEFDIGIVRRADIPLMVFLGLAAVAAFAATRPARHLPLMLALSSVGFSLAAVYAVLGAPNVALVAVLIETLLTVILVGMLTLFPREIREAMINLEIPRGKIQRDSIIGLVAGLFAFVIAWGALSRPSPNQGVSAQHIDLAPEAHAGNVVTAILADFRGLDTAGEITVVAIVMIGIVAFLRPRTAR